jgi:hypothetical protein
MEYCRRETTSGEHTAQLSHRNGNSFGLLTEDSSTGNLRDPEGCRGSGDVPIAHCSRRSGQATAFARHAQKHRLGHCGTISCVARPSGCGVGGRRLHELMVRGRCQRNGSNSAVRSGTMLRSLVRGIVRLLIWSARWRWLCFGSRSSAKLSYTQRGASNREIHCLSCLQEWVSISTCTRLFR